MALDPNIVGRLRGPDIFGALQRGIQAEQQVRQAPLLEEIQRTQLAQSQQALEQAPIIAQQKNQLFNQQLAASQANQVLAKHKQKILSAKSEQEARKETALLQANLLRQAGKMETMEERIAFRDSLDPQLLADSGIDPAAVSQLPLDDQSIRNSIAQNEAIFGGSEDGKQVLEIRKEVRSSIGKEVSTLKKEAGVVSANFNKVVNLTKEIKKGNRISVSQALVALVKLGDPGSVVSGNEMQTALNAQNPIAAITGLLSGKGVSDDITNSIVSKLDPLNPQNVKVNDLLSTAQSLISANVPVIQGRFASEQQRAGENLSEAGIKSLFSQKAIDSVGALSNLAVTLEDDPSNAGLTPGVGTTFDIGGVQIKRVK